MIWFDNNNITHLLDSLCISTMNVSSMMLEAEIFVNVTNVKEMNKHKGPKV